MAERPNTTQPDGAMTCPRCGAVVRYRTAADAATTLLVAVAIVVVSALLVFLTAVTIAALWRYLR